MLRTAPKHAAPGRSTAGRLAGAAALAAALVLPVAAPVTVAPESSAASASVRPFGDRVVDVASALRGRPYVYGATGPNAFDCSGYIQYVFRQMGINLPRVSRDQFAVAPKVPKESRIPGDLIGMKNRYGTVTHVGIYTGNDTWLVASTGSRQVVHQRLYSTNYGVARLH